MDTSHIHKFLQQGLALLKHGLVQIFLGLTLTLALLVGGLFFWFSSRVALDESAIADKAVRAVRIATVEDLSRNEDPIPLVGKVRSKAEVTLLAESTGRIVRLNRHLGDFVFPGTIIAEIENGTQRAMVLQAEGVLDGAEARLLKVMSGAREEERSITGTRKTQAEQALFESKQSVTNTIANSYTVADDVMRNKIDQFFVNPRSTSPELAFLTPSFQLKINLENDRFKIENMLNEWNGELQVLGTSSELLGVAKIAKARLETIRDFLNAVAPAVNELKPSAGISGTTIDTWKAGVVTARSNINSSISDITRVQDDLANKTSALSIAGKEEEQTTVGARKEDILSAEAERKQALGALRSAQSALEKTIVRSPIAGTINALLVEDGDYVSAFSHVSTVANNNALEIVAHITEDDARNIAVGSTVFVEGEEDGIITKIALALNPITQKIEIRIGLSPESTLSNGLTASIELARSKDALVSRMVVPISALKITADAVYVFTIDENNQLMRHTVTLGPLLGNKVVIEDGVLPSSLIVLDARGLKEGDFVTVRE